MCKHASLLFRLVLTSGSVGIATLTHAQTSPPPPTPDDPKVFVWSNGIPCDYTPQQDDSMVAMARLWLDHNTSPTDAANIIADYIYEHTRVSLWTDYPSCYGTGSHTPDLDPSTTNNTICITLQNFGADTAETSGSTWFASPLRFFTEEDRLPDYIGGGETGVYSYADSAFGFPRDNIWTRTYRHPFLWNAGFPRTEHPVPSPLREWMQGFVKQYHARQDQDSTLPDPSRIYFDVETAGGPDRSCRRAPDRCFERSGFFGLP